MKKVNILLLSALVATFTAGCGGKESSSTELEHDPVTITYASWDLGAADAEAPNIERMMIDEFEKQYPWITVNIIERPKNPVTEDDQNWTEFLSAKASVGKLPDVFMADLLPNYITNNWVMDVTDFVKDDAEYQQLSDAAKEAAVYSGMTFAVPRSIHYHGYVVNKTLYYNRGVAVNEIPNSSTSFDDLLTVTERAADHTSGGKGYAGLEGIEHIIHVYPALLNSNYEWFTFDGEKFNLDSPEFRQAVDYYLSIWNNPKLSYDAIAEKDRIDFFGEGDLFPGGKMLARWQSSYQLGGLQTKKDNGEIEFSLDFIGFPSVNGVKKTPISMDFNVISSQTQHPEEAYMLAKWLGFGKDGYAKRLHLSTTVDGLSIVNYAPLIPDAELLDAYFELYPSFVEYRKVIESQSFIFEPVKNMVGYDYVRYNGTYDAENKMYDIIAKVLTGTTKLADVSTQLNKRANEIYQENLVSFNTALEKYYITAK